MKVISVLEIEKHERQAVSSLIGEYKDVILGNHSAQEKHNASIRIIDLCTTQIQRSFQLGIKEGERNAN